MAVDAQTPPRKFGNKWMKCEMKKMKESERECESESGSTKWRGKKREKFFEMFPGDGNHLATITKCTTQKFLKTPSCMGPTQWCDLSRRCRRARPDDATGPDDVASPDDVPAPDDDAAGGDVIGYRETIDVSPKQYNFKWAAVRKEARKERKGGLKTNV